MDQDDIRNLFEDKFEKLLSVSYEQWIETGPQTEVEAYARLEIIDDELKRTEDELPEASGSEREELEEYRERLRSEYLLLEQIFGLEPVDADW